MALPFDLLPQTWPPLSSFAASGNAEGKPSEIALELKDHAARLGEIAPFGAGGRLSPRLGVDLLCIATEDHYLRVTTALGQELILFRLSDAIAELDSALGQQVHRSYWVAQHAVSTVERGGHRTTLVLVNGARVPVSRTYVPLLRATGWLMG